MINGNASAPVLVFIQTDSRGILPISFEMLGAGRRLANETGSPLYGISIGHPPLSEQLRGLGLSRIYIYTGDEYSFFNGETFGEAAADCAGRIMPSIFLFGATPETKAFAPWVAARLSTGITADCTELAITSEGYLLQTRPAFSGNVMASILTTGSIPQMATVRQNIMPPASRTGDDVPEFITVDFSICAPRMGYISHSASPDLAVGITESQLVMAIGGGVRSKDDIPLFAAAAKKLGAALGSSRVLVERGWMPPSRQIGLSGRSIAADTLITLGVSGSVQFLSGIKNVKNVFSVNTDADAPIFNVSNHGFVCDMYETAEYLINKN